MRMKFFDGQFMILFLYTYNTSGNTSKPNNSSI